MAYNKVNVTYVTNPEGASLPMVPSNTVANPQPGDQTIQDIYQNIFDNWNKTPGTYALTGVSTAADGTRTALTPASLNTGVLPAYDIVYVTNPEGSSLPMVPSNVLKNPQPLYENLNYTRYHIVYATNPEGASLPMVPTNVEDVLDPFKPDAFAYVFRKIQYNTNPAGADLPMIPTNVAGRVPQPYQNVRIKYVDNPNGADLPMVPSTVTVGVRLTTGETVLLTLDISADPDSPYLTLADDVHSFSLDIP